MSTIMPKIIGFKIMTPDMKTVISEHGPDELDKCREIIQQHSKTTVLPGQDRTPGPILHYVFDKIEEDEPVH